MDERATELRAAVVGLGRTKRNEPIPLELRAELMAFARAARERGEPWGAIARELGVSLTGLKRWFATSAARNSAGETPRLRRVRVVAREAQAPRAVRALCLVTAQGHRVEGLAVEEVAALLRALA